MSTSTVNGKPYYYSFDLSRVPSLYDFIQGDNGAKDAGCKCNDACIKCKSVEVTNNKNHWFDSPYAFFNRQTNDYKHSYFLVNYDKKILQKRIDDGVEYGYEQYVRSVVLNSDRKIVCFSPPMCEHVPRSKNDSGIKNVLEFSKVKFAEEFVEGTMVNLFYNSSNDVQSWEFSTRNVVSSAEKRGNSSGVVDKKCFRRMFLEACAAVGFKFDDLPKEYSYSFVLQHPDNTIVAPVKSMALYIVAVYYIDGTTVYEMDRSVVNWSVFSSVRHPARFGLLNGEEDFQKIINVWASNNSLYYYPGVMFRTHEGARYKFRNPNYEFTKNAKGNVEKSRFVYLHLKKLKKLQSHFDRFPENELEYFRHSTNFYNYMHNLHKNYLDCYVHKKKALKEFAVEYKKNMFQLHEHYKTVLKASGKRVNMEVVIEFMNEQSLSSQLFILKKFEDSVNVIDIKVDSVENGNFQENEEDDNNKECPGAPRKCKLLGLHEYKNKI
jgi:hypothetical protein